MSKDRKSNGQNETKAAEFFKRRASKARPKDQFWFLDNAPETAPVKGDEKA